MACKVGAEIPAAVVVAAIPVAAVEAHPLLAATAQCRVALAFLAEWVAADLVGAAVGCSTTPTRYLT